MTTVHSTLYSNIHSSLFHKSMPVKCVNVHSTLYAECSNIHSLLSHISWNKKVLYHTYATYTSTNKVYIKKINVNILIIVYIYIYIYNVFCMLREAPAQLAIDQYFTHAGEGNHKQHSQLPSTKICWKSASVFKTTKDLYWLRSHNRKQRKNFSQNI